jgi:hypothetical protein
MNLNPKNYCTREYAQKLVDAGIVLETDQVWRLYDDSMKDSIRKKLTLYLDECWHEPLDGKFVVGIRCGFCGHVPSRFSSMDNRTFDNPVDADALRRKMNEKGDWERFVAFCITGWKEHHPHGDVDWIPHTPEIINMLMENFCDLAGEWIGGSA